MQTLTVHLHSTQSFMSVTKCTNDVQETLLGLPALLCLECYYFLTLAAQKSHRLANCYNVQQAVLLSQQCAGRWTL